MPNIAGKKFPYTKEGMMDAAQAKKKMMGMKKGGMVSSASKRADGCVTKGRTRGKMV